MEARRENSESGAFRNTPFEYDSVTFTLSGFIWSKVIRMHIGLIIFHFLVSAVSITESLKNKITGKIGFYGLSACRESAVNNFCFTRCPEKMPFLEPLIATFIIQSLSYFFSYKGLQKMAFFAILLDTL